MDPSTKRLLERQGYKIVGSHSAVKLCHWLRQKLLYDRPCYKEAFYGIQTHRCLQMTPSVDHCNMNCLYCWRVQSFDQEKWENFDQPAFVLEESIKAQRSLVSGFGGDERCDHQMWEEARNPNQVAISLTGEPTLYPYLSGLIEETRKNSMTSFLVSNGTRPGILENLNPLPTQLYVSLSAPSREIYQRLCAPFSRNSWENLMKTLEIFPALGTRKVIRITLVDGWNVGYESEYARLIEKANPDFVEAKAYVFVGASRRRMRIENMPSYERVRSFARRLAEETSLAILAKKEDSRVVVLGNHKQDLKIRGI